jgi:hypothetical protein
MQQCGGVTSHYTDCVATELRALHALQHQTCSAAAVKCGVATRVGDGAAVLEVALVADEHDGHVGVGVLSRVLEPAAREREREEREKRRRENRGEREHIFN